MSNLLAGLALALGGGLQGYAQGKELQRRARMEEEEQAARRQREARQDEINNLNLFAQGFTKRGATPTEDLGYMTPGTKDALTRSVEAALAIGSGNYGGMAEAGSKLGEATETPWTYGQRRYTPVAGTEYEYDETRSDAYQKALDREQDASNRRQARRDKAADQDRVMLLVQQALAGGDHGNTAAAELKALYKVDLPKPDKTKYGVNAPVGGAAYAYNQDDPTQPVQYLKGPNGERVITPRAPREAPVDNPRLMRQRFIDDLAAANDGDMAKITSAVGADPELKAVYDQLKITPTEVQAAANRWKRGERAISADQMLYEWLRNSAPPSQ